MKRFIVLLPALLLACVVFSTDVPYLLTNSFGYGAEATGGGNAVPTLVDSQSKLESAMKKSGKGVIIITKSLTFTSMLSLSDISNKTLLALPGVSLSNTDTTRAKSGVLFLKKSNNIIIRNLTFIGPGAYDNDGNDLLCFEDVTNAWVDHCDFQDGQDGNFDNKHSTDNITVSWCRFRYLKPAISGGPGGANDHRFSNLLGAGSTDKPSDGTYNITWAYCWWDEGCKQRMVRARNASLHFLNCYWDTGVADYYIGPENVDAYVEGCYMAKLKSASRIFYQYFNTSTAKNGVQFINTYYEGGSLSNVSDRTVVVPSYSYIALTAAEAKSAVSNLSCGAGATLVVAETGQISVDCTDDTTPPDHYDTPLTWTADQDEFASITDFTEPITVNGLTIHTVTSKTCSVVSRSASYDSYLFTKAFKLAGGMPNVYASFNVAGDCTIELYCMSTSSTDSRKVNIATSASGDILKEFTDVTGTELNKLSYDYRGEAATIYVGTASSALFVWAINVINKSSTTDLSESEIYRSGVKKILFSGQPIILMPNGRMFNILGQPINK